MTIAVLRPTALLSGAFLALCFVTACSKPAPVAEAPKTAAPDVWAVVDGHEIHRDLVEKAYRSTVDPTANPAPSQDQVVTMKINLLDELITQEIMMARAKALGAEATDAEVETAFNERKTGVTDQAFQDQLKQRGFTTDDLKAGVRRELTAQKVIEKDVNAKVSISDQDIADFYAKNRAQFNLAEPQYRLAQIVVTPAKDPQLRNRMNDDAGTAAEANAKVAMLVERLKAGGDFGDLAMDFSEDPQSGPQGGDLGFVPASALARVAPALRDAVLKMQPGSINTVNLGSNYTILALVSKEPAGQRDLNTPTVKDGIRDLLQTRKQELLRTAYIAAARSDAKVTNYLARQVVDAQAKVPASLSLGSPGK
ncbi:MAG: SurA N-terminal domain-containing protein [Acidobacteriota bacterium]